MRYVGEKFIEALHAAGVIPSPDEVRRVVLDFKAGELPRAYIETYLDDRTLNVVQTLEGVEISRVDKAED